MAGAAIADGGSRNALLWGAERTIHPNGESAQRRDALADSRSCQPSMEPLEVRQIRVRYELDGSPAVE